MLSTAVALNLEQAPLSFQEEAAQNPVAGAVLTAWICATSSRRARRDADGRERGAVRLLAHLRERQSGGRHVRQHDGRGDRPGARGPALRHDRRPRHEGHAPVPDRTRHHAPAAVDGGGRGAGRAEGVPDPEQPPAVGGAPAVLLRVPRHDEGRHAAAAGPVGRTGRRSTARPSSRPRRRGPTARSRNSPRRARAAAPRPSRSTVPPAPWPTGPAAWRSRSWAPRARSRTG